jgi:5-methyltetrahydrofolate--homocysteine methyltransferase
MKQTIQNLIKDQALIIDGAMGTQLQAYDIPAQAWIDPNGKNQEGCNELLNLTAPEILTTIHTNYANSGAHLLKTNTFGAMDWVLDEYDLGEFAYEISKAGAQIVKDVASKYHTDKSPKYVLGAIGPGTKLPSLAHIKYDEMYEGYKECARGLVDGGVDIFLLETCQDPLQIKTALHALQDTAPHIPIMVSATIELSGTMLIGTDATTIATILEPFDILSLGFNCGTGPEQVHKHVKTLSKVCKFPISVHANAGLPQNRGGKTFYPMEADEFASIQKEFLDIDGVSFLGGCCGTTPEHIRALVDATKDIKPIAPTGRVEPSIASLFNSTPLSQDPSPLLIGERSNATGSKAFRELLKVEDFEGTLSVGQEQVRSGAHVIDVSVGFAGRDETHDMDKVVSLYSQKISLPLMPDSTQTKALETALKLIGGKPILNSVNLEDGMEKFDEVCSLAKRFGTSLVCLAIDEEGMAKTKARKVEIASRIYELATTRHGINPSDLIFDMLVFTVGSGDDEYKTAAIETIDAIKEFTAKYPKAGTTLGLSNISFGLDKDARVYLNSLFLHHCVQAGLSSAIVNVKHLLPIAKISQADRQACEDLLFNNQSDGDPLFKFIDHFSNVEKVEDTSNEEFEKLSSEEKVKKLLLDGDKPRLIELALNIYEEVTPELIVNEWLIDGMKVIGELFGSGQMQLPFVLQSAEAMKATVDALNPYLPKQEKATDTTLVLGTVKGDVHDVGKNLVDIILSNNGFKVINIGIKADIEQFITEYKKGGVSAFGMSGLLVKSTAVMKENLEYLKSQGIDVPVLLGGAALTKSFIDDFCRPNYDGPIFYARDAFDGVVAMGQIEKGENLHQLALETTKNLVNNLVVEKKEEVHEFNLILPDMTHKPLNPPFWGRRVMHEGLDRLLAFEWINHRILFRKRWGYSRKGLSLEEFLHQEENVVKPMYEELKEQFLKDDIFAPVVLYGYFPCKRDDNSLHIYNEDKTEIIETFEFPRAKKSPNRAISDYFFDESEDKFDVVGFSCVSAGLNLSKYEKTLYDAGKFTEYYMVHGLGVELAEALAEIAHKQIRLDLNIVDNEGSTLKDVQMKKYQGCRYSPGYPACPELELNRKIFNLLKPEEFGVELSETFQIVPEQSTCAIVVPHKEAQYFGV